MRGLIHVLRRGGSITGYVGLYLGGGGGAYDMNFMAVYLFNTLNHYGDLPCTH